MDLRLLATAAIVAATLGTGAAQRPAAPPASAPATAPKQAPPSEGVPVTAAPAKAAPAPAPTTATSADGGSLKFAIIGDSGSGDSAQMRVANQLTAKRATFPFEFVLMLGDNIYGTDSPSAFRRKFEQPYKALLDAKVPFYAALGNHDDTSQRFYKQFNMNGERYFTFKPKSDVRMFALDSNYMDKGQIEWFEQQLRTSGSDWKIVFFHHPIYSSGGTHGSNVELRRQLEPLFLRYGVDAVFAGHEHFYERIKPQRGIYYFVSGGAGKLRRGDLKTNTGLTAKGYDAGYHFMLVEVTKDAMNVQVITDRAQVIDTVTLPRVSDVDKKRYAGAVLAALDRERPVATSGGGR